MLFGVEGLQVIDAEAGPDGVVTVWAVTDCPGAAACPDCGTVSSRPHELAVTRPRDVRRGLDRLEVRWLKRRWKCPEETCERKTFTESLPAVPPRCRDHGPAAGPGRARGRGAGDHPGGGGPARRALLARRA